VSGGLVFRNSESHWVVSVRRGYLSVGMLLPDGREYGQVHVYGPLYERIVGAAC
jgi:hypothetical protein